MRIRSELNLSWVELGDERPLSIDGTEPGLPEAPALNPDLYSPDDAELRAAVREHVIQHPEGVLLDAYQALTELELKYPPGDPDGQERYLTGLRGEVYELHSELMKAHLEHPYREFQQETELDETWLIPMLDVNRLRHTHLSPERREHILGELGDVLWYGSRVAAESGTTLSKAFLHYLSVSHAGTMLRKSFEAGLRDEIESHVDSILTFETVQEVSLSQKGADVVVMNRGLPIEHKATIDNMPHEVLGRIYDLELYREDDASADVSPEQPYADLPHIDATVGKLVWFVAYASHTLLNAEFSTVMQANLEKVSKRAQRGTLFSKRLRDAQDESGIRASGHRRMPIR